MKRPASSFAAALLTLAVVSAASAAAPTKLQRWVGFRAGKIVPGIHAVQRGRGFCFTGSIADPRSDAWRCFLGNEIHDPCFSGGGAFVLCPNGTPDSRDALELRLTKPLPHNQANPPGNPTSRDPWVIVTAGGDYCYRLTGTSAIIAGKQVTYECAGASSLAGSPSRSRPAWTISLLPTVTSKRYVTVAIRSAWW
jgi:hypothetical protein